MACSGLFTLWSWVLLLPFFLGEGFDDGLFIRVRDVPENKDERKKETNKQQTNKQTTTTTTTTKQASHYLTLLYLHGKNGLPV